MVEDHITKGGVNTVPISVKIRCETEKKLGQTVVEQTLEDADGLVRWWEEKGSRPRLHWLRRKPTLP